MLETTTETEYVTATVGGQLFGLPIARVQDVFVLDRLTRVPLAAPEIAGVLNLRGRIVTAIDMRRRLGLAPAGEVRRRMAIGIEYKGKSYGLLIDAIGEVLNLPAARSRGQSGQSRAGARARVGGRSSAGGPAPGGARRRPRARCRPAGGGGMNSQYLGSIR